MTRRLKTGQARHSDVIRQTCVAVVSCLALSGDRSEVPFLFWSYFSGGSGCGAV